MDVNTLFENAIQHWRDNKGIGTAIVPPPLDSKSLMLGVLQRIYVKNHNCTTTIVVNTFQDRTDIINYITNTTDKENDDDFKNLIKNKTIKVLTIDFIDKMDYIPFDTLVITYLPDTISNSLISTLCKAKFKLVILNKVNLPNNELYDLYKECPLLNDFKQQELDIARINLPVEECLIDIIIPEDSNAYSELQRYNEYISTSMAIFGSFANIQQARLGDTQRNISAMQVCANIAKNNGWNPNLDMTIEFNKQIDALYSPNNIKDRATQTYDFIRKRTQFLANYDKKLEAVYNIVSEHKNKKILIISKYPDFATKITDYINTFTETTICASYHDNLEPIPAIDVNGNAICYKSGTQKGKAKMMAFQAQKTQNQNKFNNNTINVLSVNNTPDKNLSIDVDIIIITSPLCNEITTYLYRLSKCNFVTPIQLYTLYCVGTLENNKLLNRNLTKHHIIINNLKISANEENNVDYIVED